MPAVFTNLLLFLSPCPPFLSRLVVMSDRSVLRVFNDFLTPWCLLFVGCFIDWRWLLLYFGELIRMSFYLRVIGLESSMKTSKPLPFCLDELMLLGDPIMTELLISSGSSLLLLTSGKSISCSFWALLIFFSLYFYSLMCCLILL